MHDNYEHNVIIIRLHLRSDSPRQIRHIYCYVALSLYDEFI